MTNNGGLDQNMRRGLFGLSSADGVSPVNVWVDPTLHAILVTTAGSGLTQIAFTGAVNGSNQTFTVTTTPTYAVVDGIWYTAKDNNGNTQWTDTAGTIVFTGIVPQNSVWGF